MPTISQLVTISDSGEPIPTYVTEDERYIYAVLNFGGNPDGMGRIVKIDVSAQPPQITELISLYRMAMWQQVYVNEKNRIYAFGEAVWTDNVQRACVAEVDLSNDTVNYVCHPQTGDANELIGVAYDSKRKQFIVGERITGGLTTGSSWPNGGGLWVIPLETVLDTSTWSRVYEFGPLPGDTKNPGVWRVVVHDDTVFVALKGTSMMRIARASVDNLQSWSTVEDMQIFTCIDGWGGRLAYVSRDPNTGNAVLKYSDDGGSTWSSIDLGMTPESMSNLSTPVIVPLLYGRYAILVAQNTGGARVYLVDVDAGTVSYLGSMSNPYCPHIAGTQRNDKVFIGNSSSSAPSYIYQVVFDVRRVLTLSVSNTSPAPGETITLEARLVDAQGSPVEGAEIEFYVVVGKCDDRHNGELIGTGVTDANGVARLQYTVPSNAEPGSAIVFRAVYRG